YLRRVFFFFQAEDGIRDFHVTGVQTCALPIYRLRVYEDFAAVARDLVARGITTPSLLGVQGGSNGGLLTGVMLTRYPELVGAVRSEERRVGKGGRTGRRWSGCAHGVSGESCFW